MAKRVLLVGVVFISYLFVGGRSVSAQEPHAEIARDAVELEPKVHAETLFDVQAFVPGKQAHLIVLLDVPKDWHIYWANAGETGMPTTVEVSGPDGWTIGPVRFPGPVLYVDDQGNRSYVLEGKVPFFIPITPPDGASSGESVGFEVNVEWLLCRDVCHSGRYQATPKLAISEGTPLRNEDPRIASLRKKLPLQGITPPGIGWTLGGTVKDAKLNFYSSNAREFDFFASPQSPMVVVERGSEIQSETRSQRQFRLEPALGQQPTQIQVDGVLRVVEQTREQYYEVHCIGVVNQPPTAEPEGTNSDSEPSQSSSNQR